MIIRKLPYLLVFALLFSCSDKAEKNSYDAFSKEELQQISQFDHELLNQVARKAISVQRKSVETHEEIESIKEKAVKPVVYNQLLSTKYMEKEHQKQVFIAQMLPQILITKFYMDQQRKVLEMLLSEDTLSKGIDNERKQAFIKQQLEKYDADNVGELMDKLSSHPTSLILAQAAVESNWGSIRSYSEANNPFQISSTDSSEARLKTFGKDGSVIYLKSYNNLPAAVLDYIRNINRSDRLTDFREQRQITADPLELVQYMGDYRPMYGKKYIQLLTNIIQRNDLTRYDDYRIDSTYINILTSDEIRSIIEDQTRRDKNIVSSDSESIQKVQSESVDIQYKSLETPKSIVDVKSKYVVPNVYTNVIDLKYLPLQERKEKFIDMLLPSVLTAVYGINQIRDRISDILERKNNNQPVSEEDSLFLEKQKSGENIPEKTAVLTVDDGYKSFKTEAVPLLDQYGYKATIFICTQYVGKSGYLSWDDIRTLREKGYEFGNHSHSHDHFLNYSDAKTKEKFKEDLDKSEKILKQELGNKPDLYCYPYGEYNPDMEEILEERGYQAAAAQKSGVFYSGTNLYAIPRFPMTTTYGEISKFKSKAGMNALPVIKEMPPDPEIKDANPPKLTLHIQPGIINPDNIQCFVNGRRICKISRKGDSPLVLDVQSSEALETRRSLYTITAPSKSGDQWYWYSHLWVNTKYGE
ncbi:MAG: polysaccharide deacetylase family protein [Bacteroidales bacterium]